MKITFDVDSVLLKTEERVLEEIYKIYGVNLNLKDVSYWNFYKDKYPLVLNFYNDKDFYKYIDKIENMDLVLDKLIKKYGYNNIQLVTSSNEILKNQKEEALNRHFNNVQNFNKLNIIHVGFYDEDEINLGHEKHFYTKDSILIDDAIHNIQGHIENNNNIGLLVDYGYGWNQNFQHPLVKRVHKPLDILKFI